MTTTATTQETARDRARIVGLLGMGRARRLGRTLPNMMERTGLSAERLVNALHAMEDAGLIERVHLGRLTAYRLVPTEATGE